ncbi:MAG: biopolymer transporter ExbD [Saprospiraceae bacterium]|nr:biopolymer transporter ExbD [Saprospiraceae bacterium]
MGLNKRNKVSAEFSMSSLTDIIFLLLIFFMLTANFVRVQPFELPKADSKTVAPTNMAVSITKKGDFSYNAGKPASLRSIRSAIRKDLVKADNRENATITIAAEVGTPFERVTDVMNLAKDLKMKAIIATQPNQ